MIPADSQVRVKVYQLDEDENWSDQGTGFCSLEDCQGVLHLNVASEDKADHLILDCIVQKGEVYQQQESTLIVWTEPTGEDLALSFQEQEGCLSILNQIKEFEHAIKVESTLETSPPTQGIVLPPLSMGTLSEIEHIIVECCQTGYQRDRLAELITRDNYFEQLRELHETCEDLEATEELHTIYNIVKHIILLNSSAVLEHIVSDECIVGVVAMLEYDPSHLVTPGTFRDFLRSHANFKQVVPFNDAVIESRIRQTFRLQYLKDVVLLNIMDDGTMTAINSILFYNYVHIANYIRVSPAFLDELFGIIRKHSDPEKMHDVVLFMRQFFTMVKGLPVRFRLDLFRLLSQHGMFLVFEYALQLDDPSIQMIGAEMLMTVLDQDRMLVRSYMLDQQRQLRTHPTLLEIILHEVKDSSGREMKLMCCESLRVLLDTMGPPFESMDASSEMMVGTTAEKETEEFLTMFYDSYAQDLIEPLLQLTPEDIGKLKAGSATASILHFICELLTNMVKFHGQRAKKLVLSASVVKSISLLFASKHSYLKLAALRFIRVCVGVYEDVYTRYLISHGVFGLVINLLIEMLPRDNLIASACRELLVFVAHHRQTSLLPHILGAHSRSLEKAPNMLEYLQDAYNNYLTNLENNDGGGMATPTVGAGRRSAVSISMLVGRDVTSHGLSSGGAGSAWTSTITDEIEDAYLESFEESSDPANPARIASMLMDTNGIPNGKVESGGTAHSPKASPELDSLQDCLDIYSNVADRDVSDVKSLPKSLSARNDIPEDSSNNTSRPPLLKRQHSTYGEASNSDENAEDKAASNGRISMAEAFPDSQPIHRKFGSRLSNGRVATKSFKINRLPLARSRAKSLESPSAQRSSGTNAALPLGKRQRQSSSDALPTTASTNGVACSSQALQSSTGISDGNDLLNSLKDENGGSDRCLSASCMQDQNSPNAAASSPVDCHTPPKKARTASS
ncbi:Platinum sensitivity protein [Coemansia sp. RSA 1290]|nr:Platinum sensitivity protein [Coemansia sp. RSA 1290]